VVKLRAGLTLGLALVLAFPSSAVAHHPDGGQNPLEEASDRHQHGESDGHLPAVQRNVEVVGSIDLFTLLERPGRVSDVAAFGNYAYLGAFYEPDCAEPGGVFVIDISNPSAPQRAGFIPADPYTYVGEGVQVLDMATPAFTGQVLIHNNETCVPGAGPTGLGPGGGTSMWDVTDPTSPKPLALHFGEGDPGVAHQSHSAFGWQQGDRAYVVQVDNDEFGTTDVDIWDITNPASPQFVVETGLTDFPQILESPSPNGNSVFLHDMVVKEIGGRYILLGSYWDGGYIHLDVTNLPAKPTLIGHTDFGAVEPFAGQLGLPADWTPEGNAHQAEFSARSDLFLGADEDFGPHRVVGTIASGLYTGDEFTADDGSNVPPMRDLDAPTRFVGNACTPVLPAPGPNYVALTERGICTFSIKLANVTAAGYRAGLVFNDQATDPNCESLVNMLAVGTIPFAFVSRSTGLKLLNVEFTDPCSTPTPAVDPLAGQQGENVSVKAIFDGWGYLHVFDATTMRTLGHWALPESQDPARATGSGDLSIHEVATDPEKNNRAYLSHYSGGFRVVQFGKGGIREIGAFIPEGGTNMWGVHVHYMPGSDEAFVLASDRDAGLWILRYSKGAAGNR
jgi:hypothetical protein